MKYLYNSFKEHYIIGREVFFYETLPSTSTEAQKLVKFDRIADGGIVITNEQTAGRGQRGNTWEAEKGANLTFTMVLKTNFLDLNKAFLLNMFVTTSILSVLNKLEAQTGKFQIKWPNDLYYENQKIGGILIENTIKGKRLENTCIGIGLNVNQSHFEVPTATSISLITGKSQNLSSLFNALVKEMDESYIQFRKLIFRSFKSEFLENLMGFNQFHDYKAGDQIFQAKMIDVADDGKITLLKDSEVLSYYHKEVFQLVNR